MGLLTIISILLAITTFYTVAESDDGNNEFCPAGSEMPKSRSIYSLCDLTQSCTLTLMTRQGLPVGNGNVIISMSHSFVLSSCLSHSSSVQLEFLCLKTTQRTEMMKTFTFPSVSFDFTTPLPKFSGKEKSEKFANLGIPVLI